MPAEQEHDLREAAACGDHKKVGELLSTNSSLVNVAHSINGWTALHWAAKRNHLEVVNVLLHSGAEKTITNTDGKTAAQLTSSTEIAQALGSSEVAKSDAEVKQSGFVPSYMQNPMLPSYYTTAAPPSKADTQPPLSTGPPVKPLHAASSDELVLKLRRANILDPDFIEVELEITQLTFSSLIKLICAELKIAPTSIEKVRKLPNTIIRKDKDVSRLTDFQEIEVVVSEDGSRSNQLLISQLKDNNKSDIIGQFTGKSSVLY